jgi:hypothetical protein
MTDSELASVLMQEIGQGIGGTQGSDSEEISLALDYYYGRKPGIAPARAKDPNASRIVSRDVQDAIEATVAEIMPAFTTDAIAHFPPDSDRDEDQARQESLLCNYLFMQEYDGYSVLQVAVKDALLHRNCTVKVIWEEKTKVSYELHEDVPEMALGQLMQPTAPDQTVEIVEQTETRPADPQAQMTMQAAQMAMQDDPQLAAEVGMMNQEEMQQAAEMSQALYDVRIKRMTVVGKPCVTSVPPENVIVNADHDSPILDDARFVAHETTETESDLIAMGYDPEIVKQLPTYSDDVESVSRDRTSEESTYSSTHDCNRLIRIYDCYPLIDFDGDGIAERRHVVMAENRTILDNEPMDYVPLVGGVSQIVPHKYKGLSLFERIKAVQDAKTPVLRAIIDGTQLSSNPRIGVINGEANLDDLLTSRTGGVVRMNSPNAIVPVPTPEVPQSSYGMLSYFDQIRTERGGSAISTSSQAQQVAGDTAHGIERVMSAMEMNNAVIARSLGETLIRGIFVNLHKMLRENQPGQVSAKVDGRWLTTVPAEWKERTAVTIHVGSSHAERQRMAQVMTQVIGLQKEAMATQSTMVDEPHIYAAVTDAINMSGIRNPERYFIDPESPEGQQKAQQQQQQKQQQMQQEQAMQQAALQSQQQLAQAEMLKGQADMQANMVKLQIERQKLEYETQLASLKLQLEEAKQQVDQYARGMETSLEKRKWETDTALKLTQMELDAQRELNKKVQENIPNA